MQIGVINRRARQRYATFVTAMDMVMHALDETTALIERVQKKPGSSGWTVATKSELQAFHRTAVEELERLRKKTKRYEAELISRDWRL